MATKRAKKTLYDDAFFENSLFSREQFYEWGYIQRPAPQPKVFSPPFKEPQNDNERLLNFQARWFFDGNAEAWRLIWTGCLTLASKMITQEERRKNLVLPKERKSDARIDACEYVLRRIADRSSPYRVKNFLASIYFGVQHVLFDRTKAEVMRDLTATYCKRGKAVFDLKIMEMSENANGLSQLAKIAEMRDKVLFLVEQERLRFNRS